MNGDKLFSDKYGKDLMDFHKLMVELEQIEIVRQRSGRPHWKIEKAYRDFFERQTGVVGIIQNAEVVRINSQISEMIGNAVNQFIHPSELQRALKNYGDRIEGKDAPIIYKTIAKHKDGRNIFIVIEAGSIIYFEKPASFIIAELDPDHKNSIQNTHNSA